MFGTIGYFFNGYNVLFLTVFFFVLALVRRVREGLVAKQDNELRPRYEREWKLPPLIPCVKAARVRIIVFPLMVI